MAYQNVGTPRFYVNVLEWLASNGAFELPSNQYRTLPVNPTLYETSGVQIDWGIGSVFSNNCFIAVLGHNCKTVDANMATYVTGYTTGSLPYTNDIQVNVGTGNYSIPDYDGFSIASLGATDFTWMIIDAAGASIGSMVLGTYYDMPHSPDLNLTMTREFGGIKHIETKGGASLSNSFYSRTPLWGSEPAWELYASAGAPPPFAYHQAKSGRRIWDLSFSYLQDRDVFPEISHINFYESYDNGTGYNGGTASGKTLLDSTNFYSQVIHKTNGGQLPFIFQPDKNNNNPDQFAICKFDMNSFKFEQVANGVYNVKLKIREVW